jgi:hypothetical protein
MGVDQSCWCIRRVYGSSASAMALSHLHQTRMMYPPFGAESFAIFGPVILVPSQMVCHSPDGIWDPHFPLAVLAITISRVPRSSPRGATGVEFKFKCMYWVLLPAS